MLNFNKDTSYKKTDEFDTEVFVSHHVYTDNGLTYRQDKRFMRHEELEKYGVVRCTRCGKLMTGGYSDDKNRYCNMCHTERVLQDIVKIARRGVYKMETLPVK